MSLIVSGKKFEKAPEGTQIARCVRMIDMGTHLNEEYKTKQRKVLISFELPDHPMEDGQPVMVSSNYTMSLNDGAYLRRDLEAWRGRQFTEEEIKRFDLRTILGKPCLLSITHTTDGKYANVQAIMALPKGTEVAPASGVLISFDVDEPDMELFDTFGDKMKEKIQGCEEWSKRAAGGPTGKAAQADIDDTPFDDDIPF